MTHAAGFLAVLTFIVILNALRVAPIAAEALRVTRDAVGIMCDRKLDDEKKQLQMQKASVRLMGSFLSIMLRGMLACACSLLLLSIGQGAGLVDFQEATDLLMTWEAAGMGFAALAIVYIVGVSF